MEDTDLDQLREAIGSSPENIPLRKLYANALVKHKRFEEAEVEYKEALRLAPEDLNLKIGLANSFCEQQKTSLGLVILC